MMESTSAGVMAPELEELTLCGFCKQKFNESEQTPKLLSCKHYFCLQCLRTSLLKGAGELFCVHCWKRTELGDLGPDALPTYAPVLALAKGFAHLKLGAAAVKQQADKVNNSAGTNATNSGGGGGSGTGSGTTGTKLISENCHTHAMPLALWCGSCGAAVCRACATTAEHATHQVKSQTEAKEQLIADVQLELAAMNKMLAEIGRLAAQQREFLLKVLEACVTLKTHAEADLASGLLFAEVSEARDHLSKARSSLAVADTPADMQQLAAALAIEKQRLHAKYQEMYLQCQLDDLIRHSTVIFDFQLLKQALATIHSGDMPPPGGSRLLTPPQQNPILFLANYCMSQLYSRHVLAKQPHPLQNGTADLLACPAPVAPPLPPPHLVLGSPKGGGGGGYVDGGALMPHSPQAGLLRQPASMYPVYYFNIDVNGQPHGRIVIEVRPDVAPKMSKNFGLLATGEVGMGYKGCSIFQCWEGESVITGDFEFNNGRGGRSIFEDGYFMPDDTKLLAVRGTVGMRRTQKRHDNLGMVGSQFRIILQEMRGFTAIFGHVLEGLELVEKISTYGDITGKPNKTILITKCGKLN